MDNTHVSENVTFETKLIINNRLMFCDLCFDYLKHNFNNFNNLTIERYHGHSRFPRTLVSFPFVAHFNSK